MNWKEEALEKISSIRQKIGQPLICEICGGTNWTLGNIINMPVQKEFSPNIVMGEEIFPVSPLVCSICGNTKFINLVAIGITKPLTLIEQQVNNIINKTVS